MYPIIRKRQILDHRHELLYFGLCIIIALPFFYAVGKLLYTDDGVPAGADAANHAFFTQKILKSGNPLIQYSQFTDSSSNKLGYYPSLFHVVVSGAAAISGNVVLAMSNVMFMVAFAGVIGYALVIRRIILESVKPLLTLSKYLSDEKFRWALVALSALAFGITIYSVSPIIKLYNDGTYGELFAMWMIFPFLMYFTLGRHWLVVALLLTVIAYTHNLSLAMALIFVFSYIVSMLVRKEFSAVKRIWKSALVFLILVIPAFILFYLPTFIAISSSEVTGAVSQAWPKSLVIEQITPFLYYAGAFCTLLLLFFNYRAFSWLAIWVVTYFTVFNLTYWIGGRFGRELSSTYGLIVGVCVAYGFLYIISKMLIRAKTSQNSIRPVVDRKLVIGLSLATITFLSLYYYYHSDRYIDESNPIKVKYYSPAIAKANEYLANSQLNGSIVVFGHNPWLKTLLVGKNQVYETLSPDMAQFVSQEDQSINDDLHMLLHNPNSVGAKCVASKYQVDYIFLSDRLPGRWYTDTQNNMYYDRISLFDRFQKTDYFEPTEDFVEKDVRIRIYPLDRDILRTQCG